MDNIRNAFHLPITILLIALGSIVATTGCQKEYIDKEKIIAPDTLQVSGRTHIVDFAIDNYSKDTLLHASLIGDSIIIYWPYYATPPKTIKPAILLPDSATVSPATGTEVPFVTGTKYTVTAAVGSKKEYFLKVVIRQRAITPGEFANPVLNHYGYYEWYHGDYYITDTAQTRIYLTSLDSTREYRLPLTHVAPAGPAFVLPPTVLPGEYTMRLVNGLYTLHVTPEPGVETFIVEPVTTAVLIHAGGLPKTAKRGQSLVVRGQHLAGVGTGAFLRNDASVYVPVTLEANTAADQVTFRLPETLPVGTYTGLRLGTTVGNKNLTYRLEVVE
ncbi:hypothetical protein MKQ68_08330 [Chitinophaga horti]|uniref:IPT/TIG domain-containing protein n=1 Tax=Chitinophaga horti TaxID=2920382 RepID=A0ABY6J6V8_9BACT|nr:hypothetical protein [Chitinophaga horti]UYQ95101.1 hypothetical protein MKQ68_08330 [Chitinophaga horti]